jgi:ABC-type enterochelin transport system substrate-binding protein
MKTLFTAADKIGMLFRLVLLAALALILLTAAGCNSSITKIGDVQANSDNYDGKTITVKGTVGETVWLATLEKGTYQIGRLAAATIWVFSNRTAAAKRDECNDRRAL